VNQRQKTICMIGFAQIEGRAWIAGLFFGCPRPSDEMAVDNLSCGADPAGFFDGRNHVLRGSFGII